MHLMTFFSCAHRIVLNFILCLVLTACTSFESRDHLHTAFEGLLKEHVSIQEAPPPILKSKPFFTRKIRSLYALDQELRKHISADVLQGNVDGDHVKMLEDFDHHKTYLLKVMLAYHEEWPKQSVYGEEIDHMTWLLVQHADQDKEFQKKVLKILEKLCDRGETSRQNYAYLYDRVAINEGRKQRYGTQLHFDATTGRWTVLPLENPTQVEVFRRKLGLMPLKEYIKFTEKVLLHK